MSTELAHVGVKGMKWGVRKNRDSSNSSSGGSGHTPSPKKNAPKLNSKQQAEAHAAQQARRHAQVKMGKEVTKAVLIAVGTVAIASVAGPVVAAGAGAIARSLPGPIFSTVTTSPTDRGGGIVLRSPATSRS